MGGRVEQPEFEASFPGQRRGKPVFGSLLVLLLLGGVSGCRLFGTDRSQETKDEAAQVPEVSEKSETEEELIPFELEFEGNDRVSERSLRRAAVDELFDFETKGRRPSQADDAAFQMERAYRDRGFAFAKVEDRYERTPEKIKVTFVVNEGPLVTLERVEVQGNTFFKDEELSALFTRKSAGFLGTSPPPFVEARVRSAVSAIESLYLGEGFREVQVADPEIVFDETRSFARVQVEVEEGPRHLIEDIEFFGDTSPGISEELARISDEKRGQPFFARRLLELRSRTKEVYGNEGYPDVELDMEVQSRGEGRIIIRVEVDSGPRVRIAGVRVVRVGGEGRTRESFVRRRLAFSPGTFYSSELRRKSFRSLFRSGLFSRITFRLVPPEKELGDEGEEASEEEASRFGEIEDRWMEVDLAELKSQEVSAEVGWGSYELLRGKVGFLDRNVFGTGRLFESEASASLRSYGGRVALSDPFFLGEEIEASLPVEFVQRQEPSFNRRELKASLLFKKELGPHLNVTAGYSYKVTDIDDLEFAPEEIDLDDVYNLAVLRLQLTHDTRNDLFLPSSGHRSTIALDYADSSIGSEVDLFRVTAGTRWFVSPWDSTVFAFRYRSGFVIPIHDQEAIPVGERFFNGGENTVRSFRESEVGPRSMENEPVGGEAFNVISVEVRQRIVGLLAVKLFSDFGNVSPNETRFQEGEAPFRSRAELIEQTFREYFRDLRPAVGVGVDYLLPIGPLRFDVGWNPSPRRDRDEDAFEFHFSLGMAF